MPGERPDREDIAAPDRAYLESIGQNPSSIEAQLRILRGARRRVPILRKVTSGDGIRSLDTFEPDVLDDLHARAASAGRLSSFIPASGSGTRLFQSLRQLHRDPGWSLEDVRRRAGAGDAAAADALRVFDDLTRLAMWPLLAARGCSPESPRGVLDILFGDHYDELPKGLLPFHRYGSEIRTAFIEHVFEAAEFTTDARGECRLHFTVSDTHQGLFEREWQRLRPAVEAAVGAVVSIGFSVQSPTTDTVAILDSGTGSGDIHREPSGEIAFRPGGHGALLTNLAQLQGDIVVIKNIDNIARRDLSVRVAAIRARLCGALLLAERDVHEAVRALRQGGPASAGAAVLDRLFGVRPNWPDDESAARAAALELLDRPLRVCAMVPSSGHTGGSPFWVTDARRGQSLQIVESAEVDLTNAGERELFQGARHFNPVDLVCALRDVDGRPHDLARFADPDRAIIARKTVAGVSLVAYEHPGLWNGGMALWNTLFVEVPPFLFTPVKSLADLVSSGHRAEPG